AAAHQMRAQQVGIALEVTTPPALPTIIADPERLAQVLGNLVNNAIRYTKSGGVISLRAGLQGHAVLLHVQDTGAGIEADELPYIFDRFYRGDKSRSNSGESGLGLAIAKSIVEAQGGTITVESTPGVGSTFIVALPAA
ncbi:MAG: ATP-binding protein, partial [Caldilineaceae bacterium]|nr:ATP-binding protein [Caldilineaceae bacterium]